MKPKINVIQALRLKEQGFSESKISEQMGQSKSTVHDLLKRAKLCGVTYQKVALLTAEKARTLLVLPDSQRSKTYSPDWETILLEASESKLSTQELFERYKTSCPAGMIAMGRTSFYNAYRKFSAQASPQVKKLCWHNSFAPGMVCMIDYSGDGISYRNINGQIFKAQIFVGVLAYSGLIFCYATKDQSRASWLKAIAKMFEFFSGVTDEIWLDNSTSLVRKAHSTNPIISPEFECFCQQYCVCAVPVSPGKPTHKGLVENAVRQVQRYILGKFDSDRPCADIEDVNSVLQSQLQVLNSKEMSVGHQSRQNRFEREKSLLKPLPAVPYDPSLLILVRKVLQGNIVRLNNLRYHVPWGLVGKKLKIYVYLAEKKIRMYDLEQGELIVETELRHAAQGDEPMKKEFFPKELKLLAYSKEELISEISSNYGEAAGKVAQAFAKKGNSLACKHLRGLHSRLRKVTADTIERVCTQVLEAPVVNFETFEKIYEEVKKTCQSPVGGTIQKNIVPSSEGLNKNVRGAQYFEEKGGEENDLQ